METTRPIELTSENFEEQVLKSDQPVLVDFWATWCPPCKLLGPVIDELASESQGSYKVAKLNVDEHPDTTAQYSIQKLPTVLIFNQGRVEESFIGVQPRRRYEQSIESLKASA